MRWAGSARQRPPGKPQQQRHLAPADPAGHARIVRDGGVPITAAKHLRTCGS
jgi:hypothetical protein